MVHWQIPPATTLAPEPHEEEEEEEEEEEAKVSKLCRERLNDMKKKLSVLLESK